MSKSKLLISAIVIALFMALLPATSSAIWDYDTPPEIYGATIECKVPDTYDSWRYEILTEMGIPDGTIIFNLYISSYDVSYQVPVPESISGYTQVYGVHNLREGTYCILTAAEAEQGFLSASEDAYIAICGGPQYAEDEVIPLRPRSMTNFASTRTLTSATFNDLDKDAWYYPTVQKMYELGLMNGNSVNTFNPSGNMTVAECITLACRISSIYRNDGAKFEPEYGQSWFEPYITYAFQNEITIDRLDPAKANDACNRDMCAYYLYKALPEREFNAINDIEKIPDLDSSHWIYPQLKSLYNAGVLTGSDKYGTLNPFSKITRAEVAAIAARIVTPSLRKTFSLEKKIVTGVSILEKTYTLEMPYKYQLTSIVIPSDAEYSYGNWSSSNESIVTVDYQGILTSKKQGVAVITFEVNGFTAQCTVTVTAMNKANLDSYIEGFEIGYDYGYSGTFGDVLGAFGMLDIKNNMDSWGQQGFDDGYVQGLADVLFGSYNKNAYVKELRSRLG